MKLTGFYQALGVTLYCSLVGLIIFNGDRVFGNGPNYYGPVAFLMLLSVSILICGLLVFYQPYKLFFAKKQDLAINLVLYTTIWLFIFLLLFLLLAVVI